METSRFKSSNYITVPGFAIVEYGLSGNELLCYSLIYGFTQDRETEFCGSLNYVASALNVTKQNAKKIIDRLIEKGLINKREIFTAGVKFCHYVAKRNTVAEIVTGCCQNNNGGGIETVTGGVIETVPNNDNKYNSNDKIKDSAEPQAAGLFGPEIIEDKKQRGTTEPLCLFADSRYFDFPAFAACFADDKYAGIDLLYYHDSVADWSAKKGKKMRDWIATARGFIRSDRQAGKLQMLARAGNVLTPDAMTYLESMQKLRGI